MTEILNMSVVVHVDSIADLDRIQRGLCQQWVFLVIHVIEMDYHTYGPEMGHQGLSRLVKTYLALSSITKTCHDVPHIRPICAIPFYKMASYTRFMAVTLPTPAVQYLGLVKEVFPYLKTLHQLIDMVNVVLEIWAGSNDYEVMI